MKERSYVQADEALVVLKKTFHKRGSVFRAKTLAEAEAIKNIKYDSLPPDRLFGEKKL